MMEHRTKTDYYIQIRKVSPLLFNELRMQHGIKDSYIYSVHVPETGADLKFVYEPPDEEPSREEDVAAWSLWHQYEEWCREQEKAQIAYRADRNHLLLALGVVVLEGPDGLDVEEDMLSGGWLAEVQAGGLEITEVTRKVYYLLARVLTFESDYLHVVDTATVEEVTLVDVQSAFDRFLYLLARATSVERARAFAARVYEQLGAILGVPGDAWGWGDGTDMVPEAEG